jgi:hypothetical protein
VAGLAMAWGGVALWRSQLQGQLATGEATLASLEQESADFAGRREAKRRFAATFRNLERRGIVGRDQRLAWVQATRDAGETLQLPYLRYATGPQRAFTPAWLVPGESAAVQVSVMELQLGLVHELDLLRLLASLEQAPGLLQVRSCSLERLGVDATPEGGKANLTGTCALAWYSIPPDGVTDAGADDASIGEES